MPDYQNFHLCKFLADENFKLPLLWHNIKRLNPTVLVDILNTLYVNECHYALLFLIKQIKITHNNVSMATLKESNNSLMGTVTRYWIDFKKLLNQDKQIKIRMAYDEDCA